MSWYEGGAPIRTRISPQGTGYSVSFDNADGPVFEEHPYERSDWCYTITGAMYWMSREHRKYRRWLRIRLSPVLSPATNTNRSHPGSKPFKKRLG